MKCQKKTRQDKTRQDKTRNQYVVRVDDVEMLLESENKVVVDLSGESLDDSVLRVSGQLVAHDGGVVLHNTGGRDDNSHSVVQHTLTVRKSIELLLIVDCWLLIVVDC